MSLADHVSVTLERRPTTIAELFDRMQARIAMVAVLPRTLLLGGVGMFMPREVIRLHAERENEENRQALTIIAKRRMGDDQEIAFSVPRPPRGCRITHVSMDLRGNLSLGWTTP